MTRDVVVVGSGHNALVAACYLARAGLDVEVVEKDTVIGGAVSTVERWPGYAVDRGLQRAHHDPAHRHRRGPAPGRVRADLPRPGPVGLRAVRTARRPAGDHVLARAWTARASRSRRCAATATPRPTARSSPTGPPATRRCSRRSRTSRPPAGSGRHLWGAGQGRRRRRAGDVAAVPAARRPAARRALRRRAAEDRAGLARRPVGPADARGRHRGPGRLERAAAHASAGARRRRLRRADRRRWPSGCAGSAARCALGDGAAAITRSGDRVTGVRTDSGEQIAARAVLAGCHVLTTLELLGDEALLARATRAVRVGNGLGMAVRLGTTDLPALPLDGRALGVRRPAAARAQPRATSARRTATSSPGAPRPSPRSSP